MKTIKLYWIFWIWIPVLLFFGVFFNKDVDIQLHDTYLVTTKFQISLLLSIFLFLLGLGYFNFRKLEVNKKLGRLHILLTAIGIIAIVISRLIQLRLTTENYQNDFEEYNKIDIYMNSLMGYALGILLIVIGFVTYFINLILTRNKKIKLK